MKTSLRVMLALVVPAAIAFFSGAAIAQQSDNGSVPNKVTGGGASTSSVVFGNSISSAGTPTEAARMFRDGTRSVCGSTKVFPGTSAGAGFAYQTASYTNAGPARCVTLTLNASCSGGGNLFGAFVSAYSGAFDPTNLATNYLGDPGVSTGSPGVAGTPFQLNLAAGQTITLVVNQVNDSATNPASVCAFQVTDDVSVVPTMSPVAMLLMALVLAALTFVVLRRRA